MKKLLILFMMIVLFAGNFSCKKEDQIIPQKQPINSVKNNSKDNFSPDLFLEQLQSKMEWHTYY